jgi:FKBP-type peptidyl-prolyl cis-trans isomerase FklB
MKKNILKHLRTTICTLLPLLGGGWAGVSCSENDDTVAEYANWQERNDAFFYSLEDSLTANPGTWVKYKSYSKDQSLTTGKNTDCIYVKVLNRSNETVSPMATDSVRVSYEGRLIPSATYPEGFVFDTRGYNTFAVETAGTAKFVAAGGLVNGFSTALLHMHKGDLWRVYIPYALGYNTASQTNIPAYSTLIYDLALIDISPAGQAMPAWSSRRMVLEK